MPSDCNHLTFLEGRVHNLEKKLEEEKKKEGREGEKSVWMSTPGVNSVKAGEAKEEVGPWTHSQ